MLAAFRRFADTWPARIFFILLVAAFGLWGVGDVVRNLGRDTAAAHVGGDRIEPAQLDQAFRRELAAVQQRLGNNVELPPAQRREVLDRALGDLITQTAVRQEIVREGLRTPDDAVRDAIYARPEFRGPDGRFDRSRFAAFLNNGMNEASLTANLRESLDQQQLLGTVVAGVAAPEVLVRRAYAFRNESRVAAVAALPFAAAPEPPAPTDEDLRRFYANNPAQFRTQEERRVRVVVLSPETIARGIEPSDEDARAYYEQHKAALVAPEKRSVELVVTPSREQADALAARWKAGADWAAMQAAVTGTDATAVAVPDTPAADFPDPDLARAAFAAMPGTVNGPEQAAFGWRVFRVAQVTPAKDESFESVKDAMRAGAAREQAAEQLDAKVRDLQDLIDANSTLDRIYSDMGVAGAEGTFDAEGNTLDGEPAPIPGPPSLRPAVVAAAFRAHQGDPPALTEGPDHAWFAVEVEEVTPASPVPFDKAADRVRALWTAQQRRHEQDVAAARLLSAVQSGGTLEDAALVQGVRVTDTPPIPRPAPGSPLPPGVSSALARAVFATPKTKPLMIENGDAFIVAVTKAVTSPDPVADPVGLATLRESLTREIGSDVLDAYVTAIRDRAAPRVNAAMLSSFAQQ